MNQIQYLNLLMNQLGYDEETLGIRIDRLSTIEISELIDELKKELYG